MLIRVTSTVAMPHLSRQKASRKAACTSTCAAALFGYLVIYADEASMHAVLLPIQYASLQNKSQAHFAVCEKRRCVA